jgi:hypothetical protein
MLTASAENQGGTENDEAGTEMEASAETGPEILIVSGRTAISKSVSASSRAA